MKTRPIHWSEGMLVLPHHFQALQANVIDWAATTQDWCAAYAYGLRRIELNEEALRNFEVRIPLLEARFKDGTLLAMPGNAELETLSLRSPFENAAALYIHVVVPPVVAGKANASRNGRSLDCRYRVVPEDWDDRNDGGNPRPIEMQRLNARLVALESAESPPDLESLPLFKLQRLEPAGAPTIDPGYIPPLLACDGWRWLKEGTLVAIRSRLGSFIQQQADFLTAAASHAVGESLVNWDWLLAVRAARAAYPYLYQLTEIHGLHPLQAYLELCRLAGQLAPTNGHGHDLPRYDHENLGDIFWAVSDALAAAFQQSPPVMVKPAAEKPAAEKPVAEKPVAEKPVMEKPVVEKPAEERPVMEKKVAEKKAAEKPPIVPEEAHATTEQPPEPSQPIMHIPFVGVEEWMEVPFDTHWLQGDKSFYIAVRSELTPERLEMLLSDRWLDWKVGPAEQIAEIHSTAAPGLNLRRVSGPLPPLPAHSNVTYFRIDAEGPEWDQVVQSRAVALKVNDRYIRGEFLGKDTLTVVDPRNKPRELGPELWIVEND